MHVVISVINFNNAEKTRSCLTSLSNLSGRKDMEVLVIDNASSEKLEIEKEKYDIPITVIENTENKGFSGGHNIAIDYALKKNAEFVMILNNDTTVHKDLVYELLDTMKKHASAGIVGPKIYFSKGSEFHKSRYEKEELGKVIWYAGGKMNWNNVLGEHRGVDEVDHGQYDNEGITDFASGCCMLIKTEVFRKIGTLDTRYFLYYEDSDFNMRAKQAGYEIYFSPKAVLWHENASSTGGSGSDLQDYFISRNRLLFGFTYAPVRTRVALFRESVRLVRTGRRWQKKGIRDYFLRNFEKGSYPI